jgi:NADH:ubiquinone oxidoreductase subunit 4 (subunit M)
MILSVISIIYSTISALSQIDMKLIIAYSSIGHMATATLGLFSNEILGIQGSIYFLISHGLISSALFLLVGVLYERYHTRTLIYYRGLVQIYPIYITIS